jgi:hypothetical protein
MEIEGKDTDFPPIYVSVAASFHEKEMRHVP